MDTILFVSMHDTSRGPMAAAIFNAMADPSFAIARSAGFRPGARLDPLVDAAMAAIGTPIPDHQPARLTYELLTSADLIIHISKQNHLASCGGCGSGAQRPAPLERYWDVPLIRPVTDVGVEIVRRDLERRIGRLIADRAWRQNLPCDHG